MVGDHTFIVNNNLRSPGYILNRHEVITEIVDDILDEDDIDGFDPDDLSAIFDDVDFEELDEVNEMLDEEESEQNRMEEDDVTPVETVEMVAPVETIDLVTTDELGKK
ncbi:unnamed protein product [Brachionus calyciflorus]|uniref:Uncharacterized protein n=1 Tax=Brachionus calyciflorus TaxID=104777 RepID=A0A813XC39_9BILA|nr:unnamed protein product [Brachionus calyciflorus]